MTGGSFATALIYAGPLVGILVGVGIVAAYVTTCIQRAGHMRARATETEATLAHIEQMERSRNQRDRADSAKATFRASPANQREMAEWFKSAATLDAEWTRLLESRPVTAEDFDFGDSA